jgi:thioredoxin 1
MKQALKPFWGILIIVGAVAAVFVVSSLLRPNEIVQWRTDFTAAQQEAATSGKPIFAYFTAEWCGPCQAMKRSTWADAKVDSKLHSYVPVKIDIDHNPALAMKYGANVLPMFVVMDAGGRVIKKYDDGALGPDDFLVWLLTDKKEETDIPQ